MMALCTMVGSVPEGNRALHLGGSCFPNPAFNVFESRGGADSGTPSTSGTIVF